MPLSHVSRGRDVDEMVACFALRGHGIVGANQTNPATVSKSLRAVQRLAELVRAHAPHEELVPVAARALDITEDPRASLDVLCMVLPWLAGQAPGIVGFRHAPEPGEVLQYLDVGLEFVEGGGGAGFTPLPDDVDRVRRLRELVETDGPERRRLASDLWARMPEKDSTGEQPVA